MSNTNIRAVEQSAMVIKGGMITLTKQHRANLISNMHKLSRITGKSIKQLISDAGDSGMRYETYQRIADLSWYSALTNHFKSTIDRLAQMMGQPTDKALSVLTEQELKNSVLTKNVTQYDLLTHNVELKNGFIVITKKKNAH